MANGERNGRDRHEIAAASQVVLVNDVGGAFSGPRADGPGGAQGGSLGSQAAKALQDVLGWKINAGDSRGFMNALNQSFELTMSEGVVQSKWTPRSYAVQTDLSGGISGAQASLYTMAKIILDQALPLLDGLTPLKPDADGEYIEVLKQLARSQMTELVTELGQLGGPRVVRVDQYFQILIGASVGTNDYAAGQDKVTVDPDLVVGTLGGLREQMGLRAIKSDLEPSYVNSVS